MAADRSQMIRNGSDSPAGGSSTQAASPTTPGSCSRWSNSHDSDRARLAPGKGQLC